MPYKDKTRQTAAEQRYYARNKSAVVARVVARRVLKGRVISEPESASARKRAAKWYRDNPTAHRSRAGLPVPTRPCPALCECCGRPPGKRAMCLDHDHLTDEFRGWLCGRCNKGIGGLGDTISGLRMALHYLARAYRIPPDRLLSILQLTGPMT